MASINKMWACHTRDALVTVTSYQEGAISGYLMHPRLGTAQPLKSVSQLLRLLDQLQNFDTLPERPELPRPTPQAGKPLATFTISVLFHQHSSIQGRLLWHDDGKEAAFNSALELIYLLDDILGGQN